MAIRVRLLFAGVGAALAVAGCGAAATEDKKAEAPTATGSSMTVAPADSDPQQQAQQLAEQAEKIMLDPALAPKEKYPKALGMFRDALEIDPNNALAAKNITLIEDIYKSMGRPVPAPG
jgi:tetratricopeptide (TPR) repeat protein